MEVLKRDTILSPMDIEVETERRNQNLKCKHGTEGKGGKTVMNVPRMTGRLLKLVKGVNNVTNNQEGRADSGNNTSQRSKETQPKPDTPKYVVVKRRSDGPA